MASDEASLKTVLDDLEHSGRLDVVSINDFLKSFQHRSLGLPLIVFSLPAAVPGIGASPGLSITAGTLILIALGQSLLGGGALWLPELVRRRGIRRRRFERGVGKLRPWLEWIDRLLRPRLMLFSAGSANRVIVTAAAALLALSFFPLALMYHPVAVPAVGILALGLGLMACDGLLILIGYVFTGLTAYLLGTLL